MNLSLLEEALLPYEKRLVAQENLRRLLGVKEVQQPTYTRYITGPIERFDRKKTAFLALQPDNPFGSELFILPSTWAGRRNVFGKADA